MFNRRLFITTALAGSAVAAGSALAQQDQATVGIQTTTTYSADGRITAVDPTARTVTVTYPDGATRTHTVSPAVANFASTKVGDNVSIGFEEQLTFVLSPPNVRTPRNRDNAVAAAARTGGGGVTGVSASQAINTWWVTAVNPAANTVSLVNPASGPVRTYNVTSQAGREQLSRVKPGDSVTAINNQALVVSITPKA